MTCHSDPALREKNVLLVAAMLRYGNLLALFIRNFTFEISRGDRSETPLVDSLFFAGRRAGLVLLSDLAKVFEEVFAFTSCLFKVSCLYSQVTLAFDLGVLQ